MIEINCYKLVWISAAEASVRTAFAQSHDLTVRIKQDIFFRQIGVMNFTYKVVFSVIVDKKNIKLENVVILFYKITVIDY